MAAEDYVKLNEIIKECEHIVFFGGAGVSTESGIPDFRSKDGLYNQHDIKFDRYRRGRKRTDLAVFFVIFLLNDYTILVLRCKIEIQKCYRKGLILIEIRLCCNNERKFFIYGAENVGTGITDHDFDIIQSLIRRIYRACEGCSR